MLLSNVRKVIKDELSVVFLSDDKSIWCKIEQNARDYIPIDYAFYNLIYQKNILRQSMMIIQIFQW